MSAPDRYAVFGNPIEHSKSPLIHRLFAEQTGQNMVYEKQLVAQNDFDRAARQFFDEGGKGLNITVPFKEEAFRFANTLTPRARLAGAVNTLTLLDNGKVEGDNTDGAGLVTDIENRLAWQIRGKRVLVLGAGGAVRGVLGPLLDQAPKMLFIANRTKAKALALVDLFPGSSIIQACSLKELSGKGSFDIVINGTSTGLHGGLPDIHPEIFHSDSACYDMVYGDEITPFCCLGKSLGLTQLADGLGMLVGQAAESFYIWRKQRPDLEAVLRELRKQ